MKLYKGSAGEPAQQGSAPENSRVVDLRPHTKIKKLPPEYFNQIANGRREIGYQVVAATENLASEAMNNQKAGWFATLKGRFNPVPNLPKDILNERRETGGQVVAATADLSPEAMNNRWLATLKYRFDALSQLHKGVQWADVKTSLLADPEAMRKLRTLDENGHNMNVFGEENGEFIFASAWDNYENISADHRNIAYDPAGQKEAEKLGYSPNGNAVSIIAKIMGCKEKKASNYLADEELYKQLIAAIRVRGRSWLQTDAATRKAGNALSGNSDDVLKVHAEGYLPYGSFRVALRVKKV